MQTAYNNNIALTKKILPGLKDSTPSKYFQEDLPNPLKSLRSINHDYMSYVAIGLIAIYLIAKR